MKKKVNIFISYAHANHRLASEFISYLKEYMMPSKHYHYEFWHDVSLHAGEEWDKKIQEKVDECDLGILLVSTAFLNSKYISEKELPKLLNQKKIVIPILLSKINFEHHDLLGLTSRQILRYQNEQMSHPRSYQELRAKQRLDFIDKIFVDIEEQLDKQKD